MTIAFVGAVAPNPQQNSPIVPDRAQTLLNPGVSVGDFMFAVFAGYDSEIGVVGWITPPGWFPLTYKIADEGEPGVAGGGLRIFMKIAKESEPPSYTFHASTGFDLASDTRGSIVAYSGVDPIEPVVAVYGGVGNGIGIDFTTTIPALKLPVSTGKAVLFGSILTADGDGTSAYSITSPSGSTERYNAPATFNLAVPTGPGAAQTGSSCADISVSGGTTSPFTWTFNFGGGTAPDNRGGVAVVVVLRAANDGVLPWEIHGDPDRVGQDINTYTVTQEGLLLGPNSTHLYSIYGTTVPPKRTHITQFSLTTGAVQATRMLDDVYDIVRGGQGFAFDVDYTDANLYFVTEFEDASPDNSSGRLYRYDTATLTQQATSDWFPDDDSGGTVKVGTPVTWSANLVFVASNFDGSTGHGLYIFNKTTLALLREVSYANFFSVDEQSGFFHDLIVDCNGDVWLAGTDIARPHVMFRVEADDTVTPYDVTAQFPDGGCTSLGWNPRTSCIVMDFGNGVANWSTISHNITASYTIADYTVSNVQLLKSSFVNQGVGITNAGLWISFNVADRGTSAAGDVGYFEPFGYIQKLDEDSLTLENTYTTPTGLGIQQVESLMLDVTQTPYRLWAWGRYPNTRFGNQWTVVPGQGTWFTALQAPEDEWGVGAGVPTLEQVIHARGYEFRSLISAAVPTIAGIGSRLCEANVEVRTTLIVAEVFVKPQPPQKIPEVPPPLVFVNGVLQKLTGPALPMEVCGGYVGHPVTHSQLQQVRANYTDKLAPLSSDVHCFHTEQIGEADVQGKPAALSKKNSWFHLRQTDRYHRVCLVCEGEAETTALTYMLREAGVR